MLIRIMIWSVYLITLACVLFFRQRLYPADLLSGIASLTLIISGLAIVLISKKTLGESHSTLPRARRLVTHGIYSVLRHPIYVGWQFVFWGLSLWFASWVGFMLSLVLVLPLHIWRARAEEETLHRAFGEEYRKHKGRTWF